MRILVPVRREHEVLAILFAAAGVVCLVAAAPLSGLDVVAAVIGLAVWPIHVWPRGRSKPEAPEVGGMPVEGLGRMVVRTLIIVIPAAGVFVALSFVAPWLAVLGAGFLFGRALLDGLNAFRVLLWERRKANVGEAALLVRSGVDQLLPSRQASDPALFRVRS